MKGEPEHSLLAPRRELAVGDIEEERRLSGLWVEDVDLAHVLPEHIEAIRIAGRGAGKHRAFEPASHPFSANGADVGRFVFVVEAEEPVGAAAALECVAPVSPGEDFADRLAACSGIAVAGSHTVIPILVRAEVKIPCALR